MFQTTNQLWGQCLERLDPLWASQKCCDGKSQQLHCLNSAWKLKHVETLYIAKLCQAQLLVGYHILPLTNHFPNHSHTDVLLCKLHCFNTCGIWSKKRSHNAKKLEWFLFFPAIGIHNDIIHVQRCAESIWTKHLADLEACSVWCLIRLSLHCKKATWDGLTLSFDEQHGMVPTTSGNRTFCWVKHRSGRAVALTSFDSTDRPKKRTATRHGASDTFGALWISPRADTGWYTWRVSIGFNGYQWLGANSTRNHHQIQISLQKKSFNQFSDSKSQNSLGQQTISRSWSWSLSRKTVTQHESTETNVGKAPQIHGDHCSPRHGHWPSSGSNGCLLAANHEWQVSKRTIICQLLVL